MDWKKVRFVMLSVDPVHFNDDAYLAVSQAQQKKWISQFIHNLKRVHNIQVEDYTWFMEWHKNGFPHWHLLVQGDARGKFGMIGGEVLRNTWKKGRVTETYAKTKQHWDNITGYYEKHGYFDKEKNSQSTLPEWVLKNYPNKIRRTGSMHGVQKIKEKMVEHKGELIPEKNEEYKKMQTIADWRKREVERQRQEMVRNQGCSDVLAESDPFRGYEVILEECGTETRIHVDQGYSGYMMQIPLPYSYIITKVGDGSYVKGLGYTVRMDEKQFSQFVAMYCHLK